MRSSLRALPWCVRALWLPLFRRGLGDLGHLLTRLTRTRLQPTPEQTDVLKAFEVFDQNGNGYISMSELRHVMKNLGEGMPDAMLDQLTKVAEPDAEQQVRVGLSLLLPSAPAAANSWLAG